MTAPRLPVRLGRSARPLGTAALVVDHAWPSAGGPRRATRRRCRAVVRPAAAVVGTGVVRGRVVSADTGLPLRRAKVSLRDAREPQGRSVTTDAAGAFAFEAVPEGPLPAARLEGALRGHRAGRAPAGGAGAGVRSRRRPEGREPDNRPRHRRRDHRPRPRRRRRADDGRHRHGAAAEGGRRRGALHAHVGVRAAHRRHRRLSALRPGAGALLPVGATRRRTPYAGTTWTRRSPASRRPTTRRRRWPARPSRSTSPRAPKRSRTSRWWRRG